MGASVDIVISRVQDFDALGIRWRDLEARADPSFFQTWTWTGCLAEERFPDPVLVEASENGRTVALALFNRRGRTLYLAESGDLAMDGVFIEFNGVLAVLGQEARLTAACLRAVRAWPGAGGWSRRSNPPRPAPLAVGSTNPGSRGLESSAPAPPVRRPAERQFPDLRFLGWFGQWLPLPTIRSHRLVLNGVNSATAVLAMQIGPIQRNRSSPAPFVALSENGDRFLEHRSANTRQQLRRSLRHYAQYGTIAIERADTLARAYEYLDALAALHRISWAARGRPGAFAPPFFGRFHRALIARGLERGEIDLFHVATGSRTIGFLYNFRYRGASLAYQSGFDYAGTGRHEKPGLTCHYEAIRFAAGWGAVRYDFLAGDDRYKRSLADSSDKLHWIEIPNPFSPRFLARRAWDAITGLRRTPGGPGPTKGRSRVGHPTASARP